MICTICEERGATRQDICGSCDIRLSVYIMEKKCSKELAVEFLKASEKLMKRWPNDDKIKKHRNELAEIINTDWIYSMHWNEDFRSQALRDAKKEMKKAVGRLADLQKAIEILEA